MDGGRPSLVFEGVTLAVPVETGAESGDRTPAASLGAPGAPAGTFPTASADSSSVKGRPTRLGTYLEPWVRGVQTGRLRHKTRRGPPGAGAVRPNPRDVSIPSPYP